MFARLQPLIQLWLIEMVSSWRAEDKLGYEETAGLPLGEQIKSHATLMGGSERSGNMAPSRVT